MLLSIAMISWVFQELHQRRIEANIKAVPDKKPDHLMPYEKNFFYVIITHCNQRLFDADVAVSAVVKSRWTRYGFVALANVIFTISVWLGAYVIYGIIQDLKTKAHRRKAAARKENDEAEAMIEMNAVSIYDTPWAPIPPGQVVSSHL